MRTGLSVLAFFTASVAQLGCNSEVPTAPPTPEAVPVVVQNRTLSSGEMIPDIHLSATPGALVIRVTRQAMCGTIVTAAIGRQSGTIALVSHVSSDPAADCIQIPSTAVVDYSVSVGGLPSRSYQVSVFEGVGDGTPKYLGTVSIVL